MAHFPEISTEHADFIRRQKLFFVGTAAPDGRVNVSPKGLDSFRIEGSNRVLWLNLTGSGNETAAHLLESPRMTLMFCAFEGKPMIMRLYGTARAIHTDDPEWPGLAGMFPSNPGARQVIDLTVDAVQTSCGTGVPLYDFVADRDQLREWGERRGEAGVREYWARKNVTSIDGKSTGIPVT